MAKRVTIMIDEDIQKALKKKQAKKIKETNGTYSYSRVVNETLRRNLR